MYTLADEMEVYGVKITAMQDNGKCMLAINKPSKPQKLLATGLAKGDKCSVINFDYTNIPHLEIIRRYYLFLVESQDNSSGKCTTEYIAVAVSPKGDVTIGKKKRASGSCETDRNRREFEYLFKRMKLK